MTSEETGLPNELASQLIVCRYGKRDGQRLTFTDRQKVPWKFTVEQANKIREEYQSSGLTTRQLIAKYDTSAGVINRILHGEYR